MLFEEEENRMKKVDDFLENQKGTSIVLKEDEYGLPKEKVIRTTYKDNIDLLYYADCQIVGYTSGKYAKILGIFDNNTNSFYSHDDYVYGLNVKTSKFYECTVYKLFDNIIEKAKNKLNEYIKENKNNLMDKMSPVFEENFNSDKKGYYGRFDNYKKMLEDLAEKHFIYEAKISTEVESPIDLFGGWIKADNNFNSIVILYLLDDEKTIKMLIDKFLAEPKKYSNDEYTNEEYIGKILLEKEWEREYLEKLKNNTPTKIAKAHDIVSAIKDINAVNVTVTLKENEKEVAFKYNKDSLVDIPMHDSDLIDWRVNAKEREIFKNFDTNGKSRFDCISEIKYGRKVLYKDENI